MIISAGTSNQDVGLQLERGPGFPHWTAGFFLSGLTEIGWAGQTLLFPSRSGVIMPPNTPYQVTVRKRQREVWMIFDARSHLQPVFAGQQIASRTIPVVFRDSRIWTGVRAGLRELLRWWGSQPPELLLAENAMERVLLLTCRAHGAQHELTPDDRIARAISHVREHLDEELGIDDLARVAGLSASRFAHLFRERLGLTPMKFIELRRIDRARHLLLTTELPVQQVGLSVGFPNAQHFSIRFRKLTGQSPRAFRQKPWRRFAELNPQGEEQ